MQWIFADWTFRFKNNAASPVVVEPLASLFRKYHILWSRIILSQVQKWLVTVIPLLPIFCHPENTPQFFSFFFLISGGLWTNINQSWKNNFNFFLEMEEGKSVTGCNFLWKGSRLKKVTICFFIVTHES